ncbi:MAG: CocE/NonD family hydrolase [Oceanipulchritudo sp.]
MKLEAQQALPCPIKEIEHTTIPMADGVALAARIWMPERASRDPVPAILEFIPYNKRDFTAVRDSMNHRWFAGHGYACVRVDMRGSGDSEGVLLDEYIEQEQEDGLAILSWIAEQPWCNGKIGMYGISWGGFNGLQIAARQPKELQAVVSVASTDDRYADDVHYMGGCLLGDNLSWASTMFAYNSSPPDPECVGDDWADLWQQRMEKSGLWVVNWLRHQTRDAYWKHGSISEDFSAVKAPVLAVSGWADGYSNAVFRLLRGLESPCLGLVGPWSHKYPHQGVPGPAIGFLQECLRWWDHWLKGKHTGIMKEPRLRAWMQEYAPPASRYKERPGRWVGESSWPSGRIREKSLYLNPYGRLGKERTGDKTSRLSLQSPLSVGQFAGKWCSYSATPDLPGDQREEDGGSLVWQTPPLEEDCEILGQPVLHLRLSSDQPDAMVAVRLSDVAPDGQATRVSYGLLNLTHRESHECPKKLEPGQAYQVRVKLNDCAHAFRGDHRIRVSVSTSLWPLAWPPPRATRLTFMTDECVLKIPQRDPAPEDEAIGYEQPVAAEPLEWGQLGSADSHWKLERDLGLNTEVMEALRDDGVRYLKGIDLSFTNWVREQYGFVNMDFKSAWGEVLSTRSWERGDWKPSFRTHTRMTCDEKFFYIEADLDAWSGKKRVFCKSWDEKIPRQHV